MEFVGLTNFARIFGDRVVGEALGVTAIFVAVGVSVQMVLGLALALLFNREIRPLIPAHADDPADLRHPGGLRLPVLHHLLRGGRPARLDRHPGCPARAGPWSR